jgi:hypothetical protein
MPVNLIDEDIYVALRIGNSADSLMVATRVGEVRRVVVTAPHYRRKHPHEPFDLTKHQMRWPPFQARGPSHCLRTHPSRERFSSRRAWYSTASARR